MEKETTIIALAGKGGVGKTSLAASMVKCLTETYRDKRILAIDADPAVGLSTALGVQVTLTIDDIRREVVANAEDGNAKTAVELLGEARYRIFDALVETDGFSFIAIGRPEAAGCYCKINSYLKEVIAMLADNFDYIVIDGEAGIEQINRRVMEKVTHLVMVSDSSKKGCDVVKTIKKVSDELMMAEDSGVIFNRIPDESVLEYTDVNDIKRLAWIPADKSLSEFDLKGLSVLGLDGESPVIKGAKEALRNLNII